jgi:5'-nucleotidase (lipoprotein e(P4) family)
MPTHLTLKQFNRASDPYRRGRPHSRRASQLATVLAIAGACLVSGCNMSAITSEPEPNILTVAVAWKQTAAEYEALYHQGFNIARLRVENALAQHLSGDQPLAVIVDMDDTILDTRDYWAGLLASGQDFFDDARWDTWIAENKVRPTPGSLEFLTFCAEHQIQVFYVTSRNQGASTYAYALDHLTLNGFPFADKQHLTVLTDSSNKQLRQDEIKARFNVVVLIGDNLNDFSRMFYLDDSSQRQALMQQHRKEFGQRFILLPNPTDGHWLKPIFGESEPAASRQNRDKWKAAAQRLPD